MDADQKIILMAYRRALGKIMKEIEHQRQILEYQRWVMGEKEDENYCYINDYYMNRLYIQADALAGKINRFYYNFVS